MVDAALGSGLSLSGLKDIGPHYATTLRAWREAWEARKADVLALGYDANFWRKYRQALVSQAGTLQDGIAQGTSAWKQDLLV